jgi:three-Cys-motif partner protein
MDTRKVSYPEPELNLDSFFTYDTPHSKTKRTFLRQILKNFFGRFLQQWSSFKYLDSYKRNRKYEVTYVDGFAGAGKFTRGTGPSQTTEKDNELLYGSPVIAVAALNTMMHVQYNNRNNKSTTVSGPFGGESGDIGATGDVINVEPMHVAKFYFCEKKQKHSDSLEKLVHERMDLMKWELHSEKSAGNERHRCYRKTWCDETWEILIVYIVAKFADLALGGIVDGGPVFSFVDPYGYSAAPLSQIRHLVGDDKYVLINLMVSSVYRFKEVHPHHVTELFGAEQSF